MLQGLRGVDNGFRFFHCLYHRCTQEDIDIEGDRMLPTAIRYKNPSANRLTSTAGQRAVGGLRDCKAQFRAA
jgi:hypothetical protein